MRYLYKSRQKSEKNSFPMISICIPVYNFDVTKLVNDLHKQLVTSEYPFEILLMDDASDESSRRMNNNAENANVSYIQISENIGRSKIRNKLAETARYPYLIFMDCDSKVPSNNYIKNYLPLCESPIVCYGGRIYESKQPKDDTYLRWKYGVERESFPAAERMKNSNYSFCTNNFLIHKSIFDRVKFNENLKGYGHEDTFFGLELLSQGIIVKHIDNPLVHIGLESASDFLEKTENGVVNLLKVDKILQEKYPDYINHSRLIRTYNRIRKIGIRPMLAMLFKCFRPILKKNLLGKNPSLFLLDIYKLGLLCTLD